MANVSLKTWTRFWVLGNQFCVVRAVLQLRPVSEPNYLIITFFMSISDPLLIIMAIIWRRRLAFSFILLPPSGPNSDYRVQLWNNISVWRWKIVSSDTLLRHQQTACGQFATWSPFVSVTLHSTLGWSRKEDDMNSNYGFLIDVAYSFLCTGLVGHCGLVILVHYDTSGYICDTKY